MLSAAASKSSISHCWGFEKVLICFGFFVFAGNQRHLKEPAWRQLFRITGDHQPITSKHHVWQPCASELSGGMVIGSGDDSC